MTTHEEQNKRKNDNEGNEIACENHKNNSTPKRDFSTNRLWVLISSNEVHNISIIAFTLGLLITSILLWNAQRENTIISQRAWIYIIKAEQGTTTPLNNKIAAKLIFTNSGNTPALNFKIYCNSDIRDEPPKTVFDSTILTKENNEIPVGPNEIVPQIIEYKPEVNKGTLAGIHSGRIKFYIWGVAEYTDVFSEKRTTEFCFVSSKGTEIMRPCEGLNRLN